MPFFAAFRVPRLVAFLLLTVLLIGIEVAITHSAAFSSHQGYVSAGVIFDLVFVTTGLFYWLIIRPLHYANNRLLLMALLMSRVALFILPEGSFLPNQLWPILLLLIEGTVLVTTAVRMRSIVQTYRHLRLTMPAETALQGSLSTAFGERIAGFILSEGIVLYYALLGWRLQPDMPAGAKTMTMHRQSGKIALTIGLVLAGLIEGIAVHVLLARWSPTAAFWVTVLSAYGMLFFIADVVATLKRPSYLTETHLHLRLGVLWQAVIPRSAITDVLLIYDKPDKPPGLLNGAFLTAPNVLLTFNKPILFQGPYGIQKKVQAFSFFVDDRAEFVQEL